MTDKSHKKPRLLSLDVMRGATVAAMILVNNPGDWGHTYAPLEHSVWNGCTPTDLVFPFFLYMVGVAIVFAMETRKEDAANHGQMILVACRRMLTLWAISWIIQLLYHHNTPPEVTGFGPKVSYVLGHLRLPGVLPRIGLVFFICAILYLKTTQRTRDWLMAFALIGYYVILTFIPVPGIGPANLKPETNLGAWLDRLVFSVNHLWRESHTWDPEGLLGTIPAIGTGLFGIRVGTWLKRTNVEAGTKVSWMFVYGVLAVLLGLIWDLFFPINKALWSSSFVLYTGGLATIALAFSYWMIDVQGRQKGVWFFVVFGMNAITAYVVGDVIGTVLDFIPMGQGVGLMGWINRSICMKLFSPYNASLARAIIYVLLSWIPMYWLYKKKIYIKV